MAYSIELQMQAAASTWFWNEFHDERRMLHCNMNNSFNAIAGANAKAVGVVRGVSDMEFIDYGGVTWYIEFKQPNKKQSDEQIDFQDKLAMRGHKYIIFTTLVDFQNFIYGTLGNRSK